MIPKKPVPDLIRNVQRFSDKIMRKQSVLPDPLPPYRLTVGNYIMGYFLWVALAFIARIYGVFCLFRRRLERAYAEADAQLLRGAKSFGRRGARRRAR